MVLLFQVLFGQLLCYLYTGEQHKSGMADHIWKGKWIHYLLLDEGQIIQDAAKEGGNWKKLLPSTCLLDAKIRLM